MIDPREPKYQWGMRVRCLIDLVNDGSFPDAEEDAVLAPEGTLGEIVQVGSHVESSTPVYMVEFEQKYVVGCLEEEIEPV
ncbi:nitrogen fixation protein NifZ [Rhodoblastus acidophilus]|uniref:Nitrogen fixation protein NifZ n=1 Tax=Rhodoblastus acidophilus TaxID=1074 RepID=A0A212RP49_RHOAC|nr:nitrogen fixation protein NifZ [Rhodoblastus acidophilus]PPQ36715.1 nitrogen fixation protein NifZ [Rhodoblastus acidophilus]RAI21489.1 nitrogen fixation protein NifZ [Rhodoblastus acidophilus]SNB74334.1 nitrogen fixation protein NifZ [Rhodoblastus acidophilus]